MTAITNEEYAECVGELLDTLGRMHAQGQEIDPAICVSGLEPGRDHKKVRDYVVKTLKLMTTAEFDKGILRNAVKAEFGSYPQTPRDFVEQMADKLNISVSYKGLMHKRETPYIKAEDGRREYISPDLQALPEFAGLVAMFHGTLTIDEFMLRVRTESRQWQLPFNANDLNDATRLWFVERCQERLQAIMYAVCYTNDRDIRQRAQDNLLKLAETCFDRPHGSAFAVAVFNKFIWQVKRKLHGLTVTDHLMMVILGAQGIGKSTLITKLLNVIEEAWVMTDFRQISDDRNVSLWNNFVLFLDEMGGAKKAEMDIVKNAITANTLNRRIMCTGISQEIKQKATLIGAANAGELAELIRDSSGTRRFIALDMKAKPDRAIINAIDWQEVWQSVDETAADPMVDFKALLASIQVADRTLTNVEVWLEGLTKQSLNMTTRDGDGFRASVLHHEFREHEKSAFPAHHGTSITGFSREMSRLARAGGKFRIETKDHMNLFFWR